MVEWDWTEIVTDQGISAQAIAPIIISASRSTDIPGCYADWFIKRFIDHGHIVWFNPFNQAPNYISFKKTRAIIFWTKNPQPLMPKLSLLDERDIGYYFQFTLNDYEDLNYEPNIPSLDERIMDFKELSRSIGKERVIWRFDPLLLSDKLDFDSLMKRVEYIGDKLHNYTNRLVFSFVDLKIYRKLTTPSKKYNLQELSDSDVLEVARRLSEKNKRWGLELFTCGESISLDSYSIKKGKCIDGDLLLKLFPHDQALLTFLKKNNKKDPGQREACGCIPSKDIGEYNTCPHLCVYCYANCSRQTVIKNMGNHNKKPYGETITGRKLNTENLPVQTRII